MRVGSHLYHLSGSNSLTLIKVGLKSFIDGSSNSSSFNENWDCCTCPGKPSTSTDYQPSICGQLTVSIRKKFGQPLGLGIAGGSDRPMPPTISYLKPGFVAQRCDQIQVGDRLLEVNGIKEGIITKTTEIELRDQMSPDGDFGLFGIVIRGGAFGPDLNKNKPITITSIRVGGPAHRDGRIRPGDRIVAINGISVNDSTLSDAINLIKTSPQSKVNLTVEYDTCNLASLRKVPNSLRVEIGKTPGVDFGIELAIKQVPIWPTGSRRAVIVEGCGAIQPNDELLSIDLISLKLISSLNEVYQLLNSHSSLIRLELLPAEMRGKINLQNGECQK
uniref:PDZ domain-containing protein n=1 Tax=Meloidogyne javanica TaxID=6303 RepID=A0A915MAZ6_MELJA